MAWERRGTRDYYYRSARNGKRVRKDYVGVGNVWPLSCRRLTKPRGRSERPNFYSSGPGIPHSAHDFASGISVS